MASLQPEGSAITAQSCNFTSMQWLQDDGDHDHLFNVPNSPREHVNSYLHSLKFSERSHQRSGTTAISNSSTHQVNIQILDFRSSSSSEPSPSPVHYPESRRSAAELLNRPRLAETFLAIAAQAALTLLTVGYSNSGSSSSVSPNAKILLHFAVTCEVAGFLCCLFAFAQKPGAAAGRTLTGVGCIAIAYGFLAMMGMLLLDNLMLCIPGVACLASFPALAAAFLR